MRPPKEKLRYILRYGKLVREGDEWLWLATPDCKSEIREMRCKSKWDLTEKLYDLMKGIRI